MGDSKSVELQSIKPTRGILRPSRAPQDFSKGNAKLKAFETPNDGSQYTAAEFTESGPSAVLLYNFH